MRLNNKIAIITGSASGFGKGIAKKFTEEGANLILVDINLKLLKEVSKNLSQDYFVADVSTLRYSPRIICMIRSYQTLVAIFIGTHHCLDHLQSFLFGRIESSIYLISTKRR